MHSEQWFSLWQLSLNKLWFLPIMVECALNFKIHHSKHLCNSSEILCNENGIHNIFHCASIGVKRVQCRLCAFWAWGRHLWVNSTVLFWLGATRSTATFFGLMHGRDEQTVLACCQVKLPRFGECKEMLALCHFTKLHRAAGFICCLLLQWPLYLCLAALFLPCMNLHVNADMPFWFTIHFFACLCTC